MGEVAWYGTVAVQHPQLHNPYDDDYILFIWY